MFAIQTCPRCRLKISSERLRSHPVVCDSCGHVLSVNSNVVEEKIERSFLVSILGFSVATIAGFILVANWGEYSIEAVTFEAGELLGLHTLPDYEHMSEVCLSLRRYKCVEKMYFQVARKDTRQFARLGRFQLNRGKYKEASESFQRYFANGNSKNDLEVNYHYAKALAELGRIDEAAKRFEFVINSRPQVMQVTVVQNYVKYLVQANRYTQARGVIQRMRHRDRTVSQFMDTELKMIQAKLEVRSNS